MGVWHFAQRLDQIEDELRGRREGLGLEIGETDFLPSLAK